MIKVRLFEKKNQIIGFEVSGHAEYDQSGRDIVCAAVSMLGYNTIDTFTDILKMSDYIEYYVGDNELNLFLKENVLEKDMPNAQLILKKFELGIQSLLREYSEYVELYYKEV